MKNRLLVLGMILGLGASQILSVSAAKSHDLQAQRSETSGKLNDTNTQIASIQAKIDALTADISTLDRQLVEVMVSNDVLASEIEQKNSDILKTQNDLIVAQGKCDSQYASMKKRIQYLYENGSATQWAEALLEADSISSLVNKAEYTQQLYAADRDSLNEYVDLVRDVKELSAKLDNDMADLEVMQLDYEKQQEELKTQLASKKAVSNDYDAQLATLQAQAEEYRNLIELQTTQIVKAQEEEAAAASVQRPAAASLARGASSQLSDDDFVQAGDSDYSTATASTSTSNKNNSSNSNSANNNNNSSTTASSSASSAKPATQAAKAAAKPAAVVPGEAPTVNDSDYVYENGTPEPDTNSSTTDTVPRGREETEENTARDVTPRDAAPAEENTRDQAQVDREDSTATPETEESNQNNNTTNNTTNTDTAQREEDSTEFEAVVSDNIIDEGEVSENAEDELEEESGGYMNGDEYVEDASSYSSGSSLGQAVADFACQFVGNPYVWGGTSLTGGADCSGFVMSVYANYGYSLPHSSSELRGCGIGVSYAEAQPGDLICYSGHVAIYIGNGAIVHAASERDGIKISSNAAYRTILAVRRIIY